MAYADDVAITACTRLGAEANLHTYDRYSHKWRSRLAPEKYHLVVFGSQIRNVQPITCLGGHLLYPEPSVKYLGANLDNFRSSNQHLAYAKAKGRTESHLLHQLAHSMGEEFSDQVAQRKVLPAALYGLEAGYLQHSTQDT